MPRRQATLVILLAGAVASAAACPGFGDKTLPPPALAPTYVDDIRAIFNDDPEHRCLDCHASPPQRGASPSFRLDRCLSDGEVRGAQAMADDVVSVSVDGEPLFMPPGAGARVLDDDEAATLEAWAQDGSPCTVSYSHLALDGREVGIKVFLDTYCVSCHGPERRDAATPRDVLFDTCENVLAGESPESSTLLQALRGELAEPMPPAGEPQPTGDELRAVERWIDARRYTEHGLPPCTHDDLAYARGEL